MKKFKDHWFLLNNFLEKAFNNKRFIGIFFVLFVGLNLFFKFFFLDQMHLKNDDAFSVFYAQQSLSELYSQLNQEANPPLYFTLLHYWINIFGIGPISVKSLSALFSVGAAIFIYLIGAKHQNLLGAIIASSLFLFSNLHFDFSHEVRAFSLVMFLGAVSIYCFLKALNGLKSKWLIALCPVNAALPYAHYTSVFLPLVECFLAIIVFIKKPKFLTSIVLSFLLSAIFFIPQLIHLFNNIPNETFWLSKPAAFELSFVFQKLTHYDHNKIWILYLFILSLFCLFINPYFRLFKDDFDFRQLTLYGLVFFVPILLNFWLAQFIPVFRLRYLLFASLGIILGLSYFISHIKIPPVVALLAAIYLMTPFFRGFNAANRNDFRWDKIAEVIKRDFDSNYTYYIHPAWRLNDFTYYFDRPSFADHQNMVQRMRSQGFLAIHNCDQITGAAQKDTKVIIRRNLPDSDFSKGLNVQMKNLNYNNFKEIYRDSEVIIEKWSNH